MIKILLVDDEAFIRQGIRHTIPWAEHGMEIVGEAANGEEGLKLAIQLAPDIVLTDIQMPVMNGIELARKLNEYLPHTKVIILSAYGNTENFTSAIEVKVNSFVLKNADSGKILDSALRAKESLLEEHAALGHNELIKTIYNENQQLIKSDLYSKFLRNEIPSDKFRDRTEKLDISLSGPYYALLLARCHTNDKWNVYGSFVREFEEFQPFVFFIDPATLVTVLNVGPEGLSDHHMEKALPSLSPHIFGNSLVVIHRIEALEKLADCYAKLDKALDACFWNSNKRYMEVGMHDHFTEIESGKAHLYESKLISAVLSKNQTQIEQALNHYFNFMREHVVSRTRFLESVNRIAVLIEAVMDRQSETDKTIEIISETETPEEMMELLLSLTKPAAEMDFKNVHFPAVLDYINRNYDKDLKLADVAKAAYLSTGYLSRIFKTETGYSFKEWLNRVRIEKAKELIRGSDLKYYEIAELVGYKDYKYFSAYFSKICGISAKEYKMRSLV